MATCLMAITMAMTMSITIFEIYIQSKFLNQKFSGIYIQSEIKNHQSKI
jgi:hypothetical protein